jgi:hypothetical protein
MPRFRRLLVDIGNDLTVLGNPTGVVVGTFYDFVFTAFGGAGGPYELELADTDLDMDEWDFVDNGDGTATLSSANVETAGNPYLSILVRDAAGAEAVRTVFLQIVALPLQVTGVLPDIGVGEVYFEPLAVTGGIPPYTVIAQTLPAGMATSVLGGTLTVEGPATGAGLGPGTSFTFDISITVEDDLGSTYEFEQTVNITVSPVLAVFSSLPDGTVGAAYAGDANASGGTGGFTFTKQAGPSWLSVTAGTGAITGTPDASGAGVTVTVRATDSEGNFDDVTDTIDVASAGYVDTFVPLAQIRQCYGLNRLISGYGGSACRVERSSDSTQLDIGFVGDAFDVSALTTFVGAGTGRVVKWYDQTGKGSAYDFLEVGTNGPTIVAAGAYLDGIKFDGVNDRMTTGSMASLGTAAVTVFIGARLYTTGTGVAYGHVDIGPRHSSTNSVYLDYYPDVGGWRFVTSVSDHSPYELERNMAGFNPTGSMHAMTFVSDRNGGTSAAKHKFYIDGSGDCAGTLESNGTISGSTHTGDATYLGVHNGAGWYGEGLWRSLVICKNDHDAVRADVEPLIVA